MSIDLGGLAAVQARVLSLQARFGGLPAVASAAPAAPGTPAPSFDAALASYAEPARGAALRTAARSPATGDAVVADAKRYLGTPYRWGGTDPASGLDCSGLVQQVYRDLGIDLPRVSEEQARAGRPVAGLTDARPGDLVAFGDPVDHIGIYAGDNTMVVAPHTGDVVKVQTIYRTPTAIRRILPEPTGATGDYGAMFSAAGAKYGVPPQLLAAVARVESDFDPTARSGAGALGLMQLMPGTARDLGVDPLDPAQAVDGAARLLAQHLKTYRGSQELALAAYNAGPGAVSRYGGIPPYAETQAYVTRVLSYAQGAAS
jgi:cell wall-associated NlpC family hydrolase